MSPFLALLHKLWRLPSEVAHEQGSEQPPGQGIVPEDVNLGPSAQGAEAVVPAGAGHHLGRRQRPGVWPGPHHPDGEELVVVNELGGLLSDELHKKRKSAAPGRGLLS